jgi:conjugal transfer pilus assembly protein TraA
MPIKAITYFRTLPPALQMRYYGLLLATLAVLAVTLLPEAFAGVGGAEFDGVYDKLVSWSQGTPGKIVMLLAVIAACVVGVTTGSFAGVAGALGIGVIVYYGSQFVEGIFTATLPLPGI